MADSKTAQRQDFTDREDDNRDRNEVAQGSSVRKNASSGGPAALIKDAADKVRERASDVTEAGARAVDQAPLSALAGAIAFGAVAAALIPATARELSAIGPLGTRLRGLLDEAFKAAKAAGIEQLSTRGLTSAALTSNLGQTAGHLIQAALAASTAASSSVRGNRGNETTGATAGNDATTASPANG